MSRNFLGGITTIERAEKAFSEMLEQDGKSFYYVVEDKSSKSGIGLISIDDYHDSGNKEVSYQFLPDYWGRGIASHFVSEVLILAKNKMGLQEIFAETQSRNAKSKRLLEKLGMREIRTLERYGEPQSLFWKSLV